MSMRDIAHKILLKAENDLSAAQARRDDIKKAMGLLANAGIPDDQLNVIYPELVVAQDEVRECLIQRMLVRAGMRSKGWLDD